MEEETTSITTSQQILEEKIYVAVGRNVSNNVSNLIWALQNYQENNNKICIIHIHQQSPMIPILGTKFEASTADEELVKAYRGKETAKTDKILQEYLSICLKKGVRAEKLCMEMDSIEKGIVEAIYQHRIRKLVMGAASDKHYSMKMEDLRSKKANFVCEQAPVMCQIQFTCNGNLIHTREARMDEVRALSTLLSDFHRLVLPQQTSTHSSSLQKVGTSNEENDRDPNQTSEVQEEPNGSSSSSQNFPRNGIERDKLPDQLNQAMAEARNPKP